MTLPEKQTVVLAGDIGGTKTNLGLFSKGKRRPRLRTLQTFPSREAAGLEEIIHQFLEQHPANISSACFGIAGPVEDGRCKTTNLPWKVEEARIKKRFGWQHVRLINDVAITAYAIPLLTGRELFTLNRGRASRRGNLGLVAPGTGLGQALMIREGSRYTLVSSEGGHADFAPNNEDEIDLWRYLSQRFGHVSVERILSGPGLSDIYSFLKDSGRFREPEWLSRALRLGDPAKVIAETAMGQREPLCREVMEIFVSILGSVAGNLALIGFAAGGIYLGGGISPKILPKLRDGRFMKRFTDKGRFNHLMAKLPVKVILNDKAALFGAAKFAFTETGIIH